MGVTVRQAAPGLGVSHQTIRNWIKNPLLHEYFSPAARRDDGRGQAELFAQDLELCNSIQVLLKQNFSWEDVAAKIGSGWRDKDLPPQLLLTLPPGAVETTAYALMARSAAEQKSTDLVAVLRQKDERISELEAKLERKDDEHRREREQLKDELAKERQERASTEARLQLEVDLWRSGRLTRPVEKTEGQGE